MADVTKTPPGHLFLADGTCVPAEYEDMTADALLIAAANGDADAWATLKARGIAK